MTSNGDRPRPRKLLIVSGAVGVCALAAGVALAVTSSSPGTTLASSGSATSASPASGSGTAGPSGSQPPASGAPAAGPASAPGAVGGVVTDTRSNGTAKTSLQWPAALQNQIVTWKAGSGGAALTAVTSQLGNATQAGAVKLYPTMRLACTSLSSAIRTAQAAPPIPDGAMQRMYATSLAVLSTAAADCHSAISEHPEGDEEMAAQVNATLMNRAMDEFTAGSKQLYTATAEIRALKLPQ